MREIPLLVPLIRLATIIQTDLATADRPTITRTGVGVYTIKFRFDVKFFNGDVQIGGPVI